MFGLAEDSSVESAVGLGGEVHLEPQGQQVQWSFLLFLLFPELGTQLYCRDNTVSAEKFHTRRTKKWLTRIILTFFLNNILPSFQKCCTQETFDYIQNAKNCPKKPPIYFQKAPKYTHFSKNCIFWLNPFKKFILENICWILREKFFL